MRYALKKNKRVHALQAELRKDYFCPTCGGIVRLNVHKRLGTYFRHNRACDYARRELIHLSVQQALFEARPNLRLEYPMPKINRVADLVDLEKKFVYEIQCSPIKKKEVKARNRAYKKLGFTVIWILHDGWFNKKWMSKGEAYMRMRGVYYTSIRENGKGLIYKQIEQVRKLHRYYKSSPIPTTIDFKPPPKPIDLGLKLKWVYEDLKKFLLLMKSLAIPKQEGKVEAYAQAKRRMNRPLKREKFL